MAEAWKESLKRIKRGEERKRELGREKRTGIGFGAVPDTEHCVEIRRGRGSRYPDAHIVVEPGDIICFDEIRVEPRRRRDR